MLVDRSKFRKTVLGPFTGQEFEIRRVDIRHYMRDLGLIPIETDTSILKDLTELDPEATREKVKNDPTLEEKSVEFFLRHGIISPKIWFGPEAECPDDEIPLIDLGTDRWFLAEQISAYSSNVEGMKALEPFFFGGGTPDTGHAGEEVREVANGGASGGLDPEGNNALVQHERGDESDNPRGEKCTEARSAKGTDDQ